MQNTSARIEPITLTASNEAQVYGLVAVAMLFTLIGGYLGIQFATVLLSSGLHFLLLLVELAIVFSARWWITKEPLNYVLFFAFPLLSGITITPYILSVLYGYANGASIVLNALLATFFLTASAAVIARMTNWNLSGLGRALFLGIIGLIVLGLLQVFIPGLRGGQFEILLSGAGVLIFSGFIAYDLQRIEAQSKMGASVFLLALSLYLDIFNLFIYVLRFMVAISGNRRR